MEFRHLRCFTVLAAAEQGHAQLRLQGRHLARDRALGQGQLLRGAGVALVAGGGLEAGQGLGGRQAAAHGGTPSEMIFHHI